MKSVFQASLMLLVNDDVSSRVADMAQRIGNWLVSLDMCHGETIACWPWCGRGTQRNVARAMAMD